VETKNWDAYVDQNVNPTDAHGNNRSMSYAQVVGAVNALCEPRDRIVAAAGGLPAEVCANWRTKSVGSLDIEFGFSCMGYEISGAWGARIAQSESEPSQDTIVFIGDGSYMMLNSDIYSSVLTGQKLIILVCDNGGFAVINKLQNNTGNTSFNNLIADCNIAVEPFAVDFAAHAAAMGAQAETVHTIEEFNQAFKRAKDATRTRVITMQVDAFEGWTNEGHTWWEVGTPQVSDDPNIQKAHEEQEAGRSRQRPGI